MIYRLAKIVFLFWFNVFNKFRIYGKENLSSDRPMIVFGNHASNLDVFVFNILLGKEHIRFMAKKELFDTPVVRHFAKWYGAFPVDRGNNDISAMKTALRILKDKGILGIFPEGTRVIDPSKSQVKGGFVLFAKKTGAVLQPVRIVYKRRLQIFNNIKVYVGKPITADSIQLASASVDEYAAAGERLMNDVYGMSDADYQN